MVLSLVRQQVPWGEKKSREKKRGGGEKKDLERLRSSPEFVIASAPRDKVELAPTVNLRPSSCSSRQDEAVDTNHASIGARTKLHTPPEDSPRRAPPPSPPANFPEAARDTNRIHRQYPSIMGTMVKFTVEDEPKIPNVDVDDSKR
ncbi:unnamed protein product [Brassica oleracea]